MHLKTRVGVAVALAAQGAAWAASATRVDFEGATLLENSLRADVAVAEFYSGGSSRSLPGNTPAVAGAVPGPGVSFSADTWITETSAGGNGGQSDRFGLTRNLLLENGSTITNSSALGKAVAYSPTADVITVSFAAGFNDGLSFFFNSNSDLTVSVLRQDGSALASEDFSFSGTVLCPTGQTRCQWNAASLDFVGTAYVIKFAGVAGDFALDNITFGSLDPLSALPIDGGGGGGGSGGGGSSGGGGGGPVAPIPEPSTYALMALGLGVVGFMGRRRKAALARAAA